MSEIVNTTRSHSLYAGITVDIAEDSLGRASKVLTGISGGVYKAVGSALARAATAGKTAAKGAVTKEYTISQSEFLSNTKNINHFVKETGGGISVVFGFRGNVIPLLKFDTKYGDGGRIATRVKRTSSAEMLESAFIAQVGGHRGVFEREGPARFPIRELFSPASPQMLYSNGDVLDDIEQKMADTYEKSIDHVILRVLNGWGG